jgi:hypothetical protein
MLFMTTNVVISIIILFTFLCSEVCVLWVSGIKYFCQSSPFPFQTIYPPFHLHFLPNVHCVVGFDSISINIRAHLMLPNLFHDEHFLAQITRIP